MIHHTTISDLHLHSMIRKNLVRIAGNRKLKIYGTLHCGSGKRMKKTNRIFFASEEQALREGYRPCGHCMEIAYKQWKQKHKDSRG